MTILAVLCVLCLVHSLVFLAMSYPKDNNLEACVFSFVEFVMFGLLLIGAKFI